jgi:FdrA protein
MIWAKIVPDCYRDSVFLMRIANRLRSLPQVEDVALMVGSEANKATLLQSGFDTPVLSAAHPADLIIAVKSEDSAQALVAIQEALDQVEGKNRPATSTSSSYPNLDMALSDHPNANLALISIPGQYAAAEARRAMQKGLNILLFSDNVSIDEEVSLKQESSSRGLLVMGPDCGTAILDGVPLAFANAVRRGPVGVVGAAGTGIQEVTSLLDRIGLGISQAIGTGGRDLSEKVGGLTMAQGIELLEKDPATQVIVVVSKPPAPAVARKIAARLKAGPKPAVVCFLGYKPEKDNLSPRYVSLLEEIAPAVLETLDGRLHAKVSDFWLTKTRLEAIVEEERCRLGSSQRDIRGFFSGGTLCDESQLILQRMVGQVSSNVAITPEGKLADAMRGNGHTIIDLGDDEFTRGRPHPMIDPTLRNSLIDKEFDNPSTAVILLDVVLGYGSHPKPAEELVQVVIKARRRVQPQGRDLAVVCSVCGVDADPQPRQAVIDELQSAGIVVMPTNAQAARLAALLVQPEALLENLTFGEIPSADRASEAADSRLLPGKPIVINVGVQDFYSDLLRHGVEAYQVDWRPIAGGNQGLADILSQIL